MKNKIVIVVFVLTLIVSITYYMIEIRINVNGWGQFKKEAIDNYTFVKNVDLDRNIDTTLEITYFVNKIPNDMEIEKMYKYTITYLSNEHTFSDIVKYHKGSGKSGLHIINIHFYYEGGFEPYNINIISYQSETGEPKFKYYNEWTIDYNNINSKKYYQLSQTQE